LQAVQSCWRRWWGETNPLGSVPIEVPVGGEIVATAFTEPQSAREQVRFLQASLGLTIAQLATVLGVERQTIYNWLHAEHPPQLHTRTRTRLGEITDFARRWNHRCRWPIGKLVATVSFEGLTLLDLLGQTPLNAKVIQAAMDKLAEEVEAAQRRRQGQLRTSVPPPETSDDRILRRATSIPLDRSSAGG
jgi:transcriptional regulator with XRE-family HTH domain